MDSNNTLLDAVQSPLRSAASHDAYEKQIRTDSAFFVIPVLVFFTCVTATWMWITEPSDEIITAFPFIAVIGSIVTGRYSWELLRKQQEESIEYASGILCVAHTLFITLAFVDLWPVVESIPYFYGIIVVIAGHIIYPRASFYMWYLSCGAMLGVFAVQGTLSFGVFSTLLPPLVLNGVWAVVTYFMMQDWVTAVVAASRSHLLASKQRDELYVVKNELERSRDRQSGLYAELNTIADVGREIASLLDLNELLRLMARTIHEELGYAYVAIFILKPNSEQLLLQADAESEHLKDRYPTIYPISTNAKHIIAQSIKNRAMLMVEQMDKADYPAHPYQRSYAFAEVAFPLMAGSDLVGVLNIQSTSSQPFNSESLKNLQTLSDQAAIAIYNATLYQEVRVQNQLNRRLNEISRAISGTLDHTKVLDLILSSLDELVQCNRTAILLLDGEALQIVAHRGFPNSADPNRMNIRLRRHGDAFTTIRETGQPLTISDAQNHPTWQNVPGLIQTRSWMGAPLIRDNEVVGMLSLTREQLRPFTQNEIDLTLSFASQASVALRNAQAFSAMTVARSEAERANSLKGQFISNMSHEFKTPLNGIINLSGFVMDGVLGDVNNEQKKALQQTVDSGHHLLSMVNDILDMTKIEAGMMKVHFADVDVKPMIDEMHGIVMGLLQDRDIALSIECPDELPLIKGSRRRIRQILLNLVSNAVKYTPEGKISMRVVVEDNMIEVAVQDTGIGIPDEDKEFVFESFGQAQNNIDNPLSTGLGLPITKQLVDLHNGRIWFDSQVDVGSTFYVRLPIEQPELDATLSAD